MAFIGSWFATSIATMAAIALVPGITPVGGTYFGPIMCALVLALVNATIKPVIKALSLPIGVVTLGFFYLVINAFMLELASWLSRNILAAGIAIDSFGSALLGAIVISLVSMIVSAVIGLDEN
ncbi:MAG: phage holin family protein [Olsenella sp.]|nr:phage holin family protein [Olsenella sp.]